jgi:hypothetical protein
MTDNSSSSYIYRSQGLHATVHKACEKCGAPGKFLTNETIEQQWPGCYVPPGDERHDTPVGDRCPHCQASRTPGLMNYLGEIWRKNFTAGVD